MNLITESQIKKWVTQARDSQDEFHRRESERLEDDGVRKSHRERLETSLGTRERQDPRVKIDTFLSFLLLFATIVVFFPTNVFAADCNQVTPSGNLTVTTGCMFSGTVNGVDDGTGNTNTANLAVATGGTLTVGATQQVAMGSLSIGGGSIVIIDGGALKFGTPLWMTDADSDGIPSTTTQYAVSTPPPNARRRNVLTTATIADTNDNQSCPENINPSGACNMCFSGGIVNESDGQDLFSECQTYFSCNGSGICSRHAKRVFLSSATDNGNLGGLSGADNTCQTLANLADLGGTWKAWLSNRTVSAASRLSQSTWPYILVDNATKIADNWSDLTDGTLDASINRNESGKQISGSNNVWTNTKVDGTIYATTNAATCSNWTSGSASNTGRVGLSNSTNSNWTNSSSPICNGSYRLYCLEQ